MNLEIHIKDGQCKVIEGIGRRVFRTTEEALGLALLRLNPATATGNIALNWTDFLADRGVAMALSGDRALTLLKYPSFTRSIVYRRGDSETQNYNITFPPLLWAMSFRTGRLVKSQLWAIKAGMESRLSTTGTENVLACFPYGNVYAHGGVCWGTTRLTDVRQPGDVHETFFASEFNGDLYTRSYIGVRDEGLQGYLHRITNGGQATGILNQPVESTFTTSVSAVTQDIARG